MTPRRFAFLPPQPQQREELRGKHGVAVLSPLALFDADQHPLAVDIVDLEAGNFGHPQACGCPKLPASRSTISTASGC